MKVKMIDFEESVLRFLGRVVGTLPTTGHKLAAGAMLAGSTAKLEEMLSSLADADGCVDTDLVRKLVKEGFAAAGEKATFTVGSDGLAWLLKPVNVSVTAGDVEAMLAEAEKHAVQ